MKAGIYAVGRGALAAEFADESDEVVRKALIEAQVFLTYRRDLNNLSIQESRLRRQYERDEAELKRLLAERAAARQKQERDENYRWTKAIQNYRTAQSCGVPFDPAEIGFEFSTEQIQARLRQIQIDAAITEGRYFQLKALGRFDKVA